MSRIIFSRILTEKFVGIFGKIPEEILGEIPQGIRGGIPEEILDYILG